MKNKLILTFEFVLVFIVYSVIAFFAFDDKNGVFICSYFFTLLAFASQIVIWNLVFKKNSNRKEFFLESPILVLGIGYMVFQIVVSFIFMALLDDKVKAAFVIQFILFALDIGISISIFINKNIVKNINGTIEKETQFMKELYMDVENMLTREQSTEQIKVLKKLSELIKYSDPKSSCKLKNIENEITVVKEEINLVQTRHATGDIIDLIEKMTRLLNERNRQCKAFK